MPQLVIPDNEKAAVREADRYQPDQPGVRAHPDASSPNPTIALPPAPTRLTQGTGGHAMEATHYQHSPIQTDRLRDWIAKWIGASWVWHAKFLSGTSSPLRDPENTGALAIFVFRPGPGTDSPRCRVWICRNPVETDVADDLLGPVEPGFPAPWGPARIQKSQLLW